MTANDTRKSLPVGEIKKYRDHLKLLRRQEALELYGSSCPNNDVLTRVALLHQAVQAFDGIISEDGPDSSEKVHDHCERMSALDRELIEGIRELARRRGWTVKPAPSGDRYLLLTENGSYTIDGIPLTPSQLLDRLDDTTPVRVRLEPRTG